MEVGKIYFLNLSCGLRQVRVWGCWALSVLMGFFSVYSAYRSTTGFAKNLKAMYFLWPGNFNFYVYALIAILPEILLGEEFMRRTVNNCLYVGVRRRDLFMGKFLYLLTIVIFGAVLQVGVYLTGVGMCGKILGKTLHLGDFVSTGQYVLYFLLIVSVYSAVSAFAFCLCILSDSQIRAAIVGFVILYSELLITKLSESADISETSLFIGYLPMHLAGKLTNYAAQGKITQSECLGYFCVLISETVVFLVLGVRLFEKRDLM